MAAPPSTSTAASPDAETAGDALDNDDDVRAPWHFWLMMAAVVIYLGWRLVQAIWWAIQQVM